MTVKQAGKEAAGLSRLFFAGFMEKLKKQLTIPQTCFIIILVRAGVVQW